MIRSNAMNGKAACCQDTTERQPSALARTEPAAKRRKNAAHGASRG